LLELRKLPSRLCISGGAGEATSRGQGVISLGRKNVVQKKKNGL